MLHRDKRGEEEGKEDIGEERRRREDKGGEKEIGKKKTGERLRRGQRERMMAGERDEQGEEKVEK